MSRQQRYYYYYYYYYIFHSSGFQFREWLAAGLSPRSSVKTQNPSVLDHFSFPSVLNDSPYMFSLFPFRFYLPSTYAAYHIIPFIFIICRNCRFSTILLRYLFIRCFVPSRGISSISREHCTSQRHVWLSLLVCVHRRPFRLNSTYSLSAGCPLRVRFIAVLSGQMTKQPSNIQQHCH